VLRSDEMGLEPSDESRAYVQFLVPHTRQVNICALTLSLSQPLTLTLIRQVSTLRFLHGHNHIARAGNDSVCKLYRAGHRSFINTVLCLGDRARDHLSLHAHGERSQMLLFSCKDLFVVQ